MEDRKWIYDAFAAMESRDGMKVIVHPHGK